MDEILQEGLKGHYLGGGRVSHCALVNDDLYLAVKSYLLIYSTRNARLLHVQKISSSEITGVKGSPGNSRQLLVSTLSGGLALWDTTDWRLMKEVQVGEPVHTLLVPQSVPHVFLVTRDTEQGYTTLRKYDTASLTSLNTILTIKKSCENFHVSQCGSFILFTRDKRVRVVNTRTCATFTRFTHDVDLCAAALHPSQNLAAVADEEGKICVLTDWMIKGCDTVTVHHWHAHKVGGMKFAPRSDALFSGGAESVLVKWLDGERQFLPRVGAGIDHVMCTQTGDTVVLVTEDTAVHIVSLNTWTVQHKICNVLKRANKKKATQAICSKGSEVIFAATPGFLQVYDVEKREHARTLDITSQNITTGHNKNKSLSYIEISHFKVSEDGAWLITVERRDDGFVTPENRLKFWSLEGEYKLVSCVDPPHSKRVTSLSVGQIAGIVAVTTSLDSTTKVWELDEEKGGWGLGQTLKHRAGAAHCSVLSPDGSVLVVGYQTQIALYSTTDWNTQGELVQAGVQHLFLAGLSLLAAGKDRLVLWDLSSLSQSWEVAANISTVLPLPNSAFLALISRKSVTDAVVVGARSAEPLALHSFVCPGAATSACMAGDRILVLTEEQELYSLSCLPPPPLAISPRELPDSLSVFTQLLQISSPKETPTPAPKPGTKTTLLDAPCSSLPPLNTICSEILSSFLPPRTPKTTANS